MEVETLDAPQGPRSLFRVLAGDESDYVWRVSSTKVMRFQVTGATRYSALGVSSQPGTWLASARSELDALTRLPVDYDGDGGEPVARDAAVIATAILVHLARFTHLAPQLVPVGDGAVMLEWHRGVSDLEIEVGSGGGGSILAQRSDSGRRFEVEQLLPFFSDLPYMVRFLNLDD